MKSLIIKTATVTMSIVLAFSTSAMARASKHKVVKNAEATVNTSNYILYQNFRDVDTGDLPEGWNASNTNGTLSTEKCNNGKSEKNCLVLDDTNMSAAGPRITIPVTDCNSGKILMETRFKFEKTGSSNYTVMTVQANGPQGKIVEGFMPSAATSFTVRVGDATSYIMPNWGVGQWYVLRYLFDFDNHTFEAYMLDEASGKTKLAEAMKMADNAVNSFTIMSENYSGKWYFDYFNVSRSKVGLKELAESTEVKVRRNIKKGVEAVKIDAPQNHALANSLNIKIDGKYRYPYEKLMMKNDNLMITAKSLAYMLSASYRRDEKGCVIELENNKIEISDDEVKVNGKMLTLPEKAITENNKIYVPAKDVFGALGYSYHFDAESCEAVLEQNAAAAE